MTIIKESPLIQELLTQERQLGFEEGEWKATLEALQQILTIRFKVALGELKERLDQLDLQSLKQLNETALTVQTLAAFEKALAERLTKSATPDRSETEGDEPSK